VVLRRNALWVAQVPESQSGLLAFPESGATARLPELVCKLAASCVRAQVKAQVLQVRSPNQE
jgi:hypothetical protein